MSSISPVHSVFGRLLVSSAVAVLCAWPAYAGQTSPTPSHPASSTAKKSPRHRARPAQAAATPATPAPAPAAPEMPHWPVNDAPSKATVTWDSHGLSIAATNSSLHQILDQVSADTGAKVEGLGTDERVFGQYGPGDARDVLSQLLHGSSYNVLMIGDQGAGTPRQIVLSARHSGPANLSVNRAAQEQPDEDVPDQPEADDQPAQPPMTNRPPVPSEGPPGAPRTPQQVLQELQQRQQQMQDQQQQQPH